MATVWCTKYCLTGPITEHELIKESDDGLVTVKWLGSMNGQMYLHQNEWHRNKRDATERFDVMVSAKLRSLRRAIKKFESMEDAGPTFAGVEPK